MRRLGVFLFLFALTLLIPMGYLVFNAFRSLEQEEKAKLRFFADTLFDSMEEELAVLLADEEARQLDAYGHTLAPDEEGKVVLSPLAVIPEDPYILGYFQNNPDGSFQTPLMPGDRFPEDMPFPVRERIQRLMALNTRFNNVRSQVIDALPPFLDVEAEASSPGENLAEQYLDMPKKEKRAPASESALRKLGPREKAHVLAWLNQGKAPMPSPNILELEIAPLQAVALDREHLIFFRRVVLENRVYRQGFILLVPEFMRHLAREYFADQPMARYAGLWLKSVIPGKGEIMIQSGAVAEGKDFQLKRVFPRPFDFIQATLACDDIPESPGRGALQALAGGLVLIVTIGLFAIYRSARVVIEHSRRRAGFVSSVTHELKTPLANIQLYLDMLEQGMARDTDQLNQYLNVVRKESGRLGRLISNVLEFAQLEEGRRQLNLQPQPLLPIVEDAAQHMAAKLGQHGFRLSIQAPDSLPEAVFDREALLQILLNLLDNSIKFARDAERKEILVSLSDGIPWISLEVRDFGPGIPLSARKKIFQDFYRLDDSLTRRTAGTGIGLALVRKLIIAMHGEVEAHIPQEEPGLRIILRFPQAPAN